MKDSVWTETLSAFREKACGTDPVPASVAISAVTASFALGLLAKVLVIVGKRKNFTGDRQRIGPLLHSARAESLRLTQLADEDVQAFNEYMECLRHGKDRAGQELAAAVRKAIEVPMSAARSTVRGLELCAEAAGMVQGLTAADIGGAAALLAGAARAMLLSVDFNIREMHSDAPFSEAVNAERRDLSALLLARETVIARHMLD